MKKQLWILALGLFVSSASYAQEYGLTLGVHQTSATVDPSGNSTMATAGVTGSTNSSLGYDLGLTVAFELMPNFRFRSGALYNYRPFEFKLSAPAGAAGQTVTFKYAYIDVPVNVQYNFNQTVGVYGGMIVGIKASDTVEMPSTFTSTNLNAKSLYPLFNVGMNFMFEDMIGIDVYYEMGAGSFSDIAKNYSNFGMHFIYWL